MDKTLGELIQQALNELGWSNAELARRSGFSSTHIGNLIRDYSPGTKSGKPTRLPMDTVDRIADALQRPRTLFRRAAGLLPQETEPEDSRQAEADRAAELIKDFLTLSPAQQAQAIAVIKILQSDHPELLKAPIKIINASDLTESDAEIDTDSTPP